MAEAGEVTVKVNAEKVVKPGWKTTEFWMTAMASIVSLLLMSGVVNPDGNNTASKIVAGVIVVLSTLGYQVQRTKAKNNVSNT